MVSVDIPASRVPAETTARRERPRPTAHADVASGVVSGTPLTPSNLDDLDEPGVWSIVGADHIENAPTATPGTLEVVLFASAGVAVQTYTTLAHGPGSAPQLYMRTTLLAHGWTGVPWTVVGAPPAGTPPERTALDDAQASDHATRVEFARARRGGGIGTGGQPVVMLRFDHWLAAFRDKCLPVLRAHGLVGTLNVNFDNLGTEQNGGGSITWDDVQAWNQYDGIEIANHGSTHTNASTREAIRHEIMDGRRNLEAAMPRVAVETWQEHGSAYLIASDIEGDEGLDLGRTLDAFTQSYAGRLVMAEHAIVEGKVGGFYPALSGSPQIGQSHFSIDRQRSAQTIATVQFAQRAGRGVTIYLHPGLLDTVRVGNHLWAVSYGADGSRTLTPSIPGGGALTFTDDAALRAWAAANGHIVHQTSADFTATCAWLEAERDAGRIMVMTAAGGGFADASHARRENLLVRDLWQGSAWARSGSGRDFRAVSTPRAGAMSQRLLLYTRFGWAMGAAHELVVLARAQSTTSLMLSVEQLGNPDNWCSTRTFTVPGDGKLHTYRLNIALPRDRSIPQMIVRVGGPDLTIEGEPQLVAI
ncbi:hypothetical protein DEO23_14565 [Brachybacterium endophyticum]|uniref:NodB homology domain-containing protein n=1 Tax=Brachybacterium endophyticum TaxID=2182385 RepID=A0A2U2RHE8_9MICO|nr:polysaccharide deacetylase family protein [Brachybacterium endophyticum]PWH05287.1 hypothetical protein DEO23_14565 [Brachybacterium endophyticum]